MTLTRKPECLGSSAPKIDSMSLVAKLESMDRCLKQLVGVVQSLSAAMGERSSSNEYPRGYKQGFADGYSRGSHEVNACG